MVSLVHEGGTSHPTPSATATNHILPFWLYSLSHLFSLGYQKALGHQTDRPGIRGLDQPHSNMA